MCILYYSRCVFLFILLRRNNRTSILLSINWIFWFDLCQRFRFKLCQLSRFDLCRSIVSDIPEYIDPLIRFQHTAHVFRLHIDLLTSLFPSTPKHFSNFVRMENKKTENIISEYHLNRHQPDKPQFAIYDLNDYVTEYQGHTTKPHIHSYYQIIWFKQGSGKHFVDFKSYDVKDNAVFLIAKDQVHYFDNNIGYKGILLHFNEAFLVQKESETDFFLKCNLFNNPYQQPFCLIGKETEILLAEYILQIEREIGNPAEFGKEELLRAYLKSFLIQIQRLKQTCEKTQKNIPFELDEKRIQLIKFVNLINENYIKGFTVSEYARLLMISSRTLSGLTNQLLNKTPSLMIQERIILEAKRLLLHSDLNINQIGYRLGFDDPSYFVKYFKKHTQISPSDFRKFIS